MFEIILYFQNLCYETQLSPNSVQNFHFLLKKCMKCLGKEKFDHMFCVLLKHGRPKKKFFFFENK